MMCYSMCIAPTWICILTICSHLLLQLVLAEDSYSLPIMKCCGLIWYKFVLTQKWLYFRITQEWRMVWMNCWELESVSQESGRRTWNLKDAFKSMAPISKPHGSDEWHGIRQWARCHVGAVYRAPLVFRNLGIKGVGMNTATVPIPTHFLIHRDPHWPDMVHGSEVEHHCFKMAEPNFLLL